MDPVPDKATPNESVIAPKKSIKKKGPLNRFFGILRECIALLIWIYILIKLFVFDIDVFLVGKYQPTNLWLLNYKFIILAGVLAVIWLFTKNKHIIYWSLYILLYPLIVMLWKIPYFIFKQKSWILAFAVINTVISFFKSFKYSFVLFAIYLVSIFIVTKYSNHLALWLTVTVLLGIILLTYINRFIVIFKPSTVFQTHIKILAGFRKHAQPSMFALTDEIKSHAITELGEKQLEKWATSLQFSVLFNRICLFVAKKLRDYLNSKINFAYYTLGILSLVILTVITFAFINFAIYKIEPSQFTFAETPGIFTFFYYSFNNLLFNTIQELSAASALSQVASMIESFLALALIVIFGSLFFSVRSEKYAKELNQVITNVENEGLEMEKFIASEYKLNSIDEAVMELDKIKAGMTKLIYTITENIK